MYMMTPDLSNTHCTALHCTAGVDVTLHCVGAAQNATFVHLQVLVASYVACLLWLQIEVTALQDS